MEIQKSQPAGPLNSNHMDLSDKMRKQHQHQTKMTIITIRFSLKLHVVCLLYPWLLHTSSLDVFYLHCSFFLLLSKLLPKELKILHEKLLQNMSKQS